jgi:hypothetical protein
MKKTLIVSYTGKKLFAAQAAFTSNVLEFIESSELQKDEIPDFAVVETIEKMTELREEFSSKKWDAKFIFIGRNNKTQEFFDLEGRVLIDPFLLTSKIGSMLLKRSIESDSSIHLQEIFGENFKKYYTYKVTNIYRIGYFADLICKDAVDQKLNFIAIRSFFDHALMFNSYLVDLGLANFPCELEFSFKENSFVLMLHIATAGLKHGQLLESLGEENLRNPLSSLLKSCFKNTDYLDVLNNTKNKRLSIVGLWLSEEQRAQLSTSSISIHTIGDESERKNAIENNQNDGSSYDYKHQIDPKQLEALDKEELPKLPGAHKVIEELDEDSVLKTEEGVLEEITSFIQNQVELKNLDMEDEGQVININQLSVEDVKKILKDHPDQELVQKFSSEEEKVLATVVASGKNPEDLINVVKGKKLKEEEDIKVRLSSAAEVINNQISSGGGLFKDTIGQNDVQFINSTFKDKPANEILVNPLMVLEDSEFKIDGQVITFSDQEKNELSEQLQNTFDELLLSPDFQVLNPTEQQKVVEEQVKQVIQNKVAKEPDENQVIKVAMGNIQKELVTKFKSSGNNLDPDEQVEIITSSIIKNAKELKTVIRGGQNVEDVVEEIIEQMSIPEDQKKAFKQKIQKKIVKPKDPKAVFVNSSIDEVEDVEVVEEQEVEEPSSTGENELKIQKVKKVVKVPKKVIKNKVSGPNAEPEIIGEIVYEEEIIEVEEEFPAQNQSTEPKIVKKVVKVPKKVVKKSPALNASTDEDEVIEETVYEEQEIVEESTDVGNVKIAKIKPSTKKADISQKISGSNDSDEDDAVMVSGTADEENDESLIISGGEDSVSDEGYSVKKSSGKKVQKQKNSEDVVIEGGEEEEIDDGYQISRGQGKKVKSKNPEKRIIDDGETTQEDDGYKVRQGSGVESEQDDGYTVKNGMGAKTPGKKVPQEAADNSHLLKRIEELEKKLKAERAQMRELEKAKNVAKEKVKAVKDSVSEITKNIKEPDLSVEATDPQKIDTVVSEIKSASGLSEMQKAKMLEVLEKEKQINLKYAEMQDAYRKTKAALDTTENKYAAEIDELERSNRHKEHIVEQMKTKVANSEKDHQIELKRITFDLKKQAQRASTVEVDRYKQKAAALEREKNAMKRMLDDLKSSVSKEKVKIVEKEVKASPKIAEFEAQKKRAEVKLQATETELTELKKTMAAKDKTAREVGEQRIKYEAEMNKWKKDALTKQSEVEKAVNEKKRAEEEALIFKRKYEETVKAASLEKKNEANAAQAQQDSKASLANAKVAEDKVLQLKEEMAKEKSQLNKDIAKEKEQLEEMKKSYLAESNKVKALETKMKEMAQTIEEQAAALKNHESAVAEANAKASGGAKSNITAKDLSVLATKNRLLEETSKKVNKDFNDTKAKLEEAKKEIANLTKKTNETQFKLQEKEKLAEKLQNELKAIKDKEAEAKKKETEAKKAA